MINEYQMILVDIIKLVCYYVHIAKAVALLY